MEKLLDPIYTSLVLRLTLGVLIVANIIMLVQIRTVQLSREHWIERVGLTYYQLSGIFMAVFLGFVAAFLPSFLGVSAIFVCLIVAVNTLLVGTMQSFLATKGRQRHD